MINIRQLYNLDFNSSFIRALLRIYYKSGKFYRIPFGALRGIWLWYDRSINFHAMLGVWEKGNFSALEKVLGNLLNRGTMVNAWDIGANIGLYSLFLSKFSPKIMVHAFEPVVDTLELFRKNIGKNQLTNIKIIEKAAGAVDGDVTFYIGHHHKSSLERDWTSDRGTSDVREIKVPSITVDSVVEKDPGSAPDFIKIDVEGAASHVFAGASSTLQQIRPIILIESHTANEDRAIIRVLSDFNYKAFRINDQSWVTCPAEDYRNTAGVWGTMLLFPQEKGF